MGVQRCLRRMLFALSLACASLHAAEKPVFAGYVEELGADLACSACAQSTESLRALFSSKMKALKSAKEDRRAVLQSILDAACGLDRFPEEMIILGNEGVRRYQDYRLFMKKFGTSSEVNRDTISSVACWRWPHNLILPLKQRTDCFSPASSWQGKVTMKKAKGKTPLCMHSL
eukprot:TRINITY_DN30555_c0_g1_i1.p1 TRINITY_DN30555_c0_g1~~TRINITY_DN30555_c0_g1_i1.p1  ORF type:complete len:183 (+),score=37.18 TRINITY_DN30555_c0_g1_i1:32-550(+)